MKLIYFAIMGFFFLIRMKNLDRADQQLSSFINFIYYSTNSFELQSQTFFQFKDNFCIHFDNCFSSQHSSLLLWNNEKLRLGFQNPPFIFVSHFISLPFPLNTGTDFFFSQFITLLNLFFTVSFQHCKDPNVCLFPLLHFRLS